MFSEEWYVAGLKADVPSGPVGTNALLNDQCAKRSLTLGSLRENVLQNVLCETRRTTGEDARAPRSS